MLHGCKRGGQNQNRGSASVADRLHEIRARAASHDHDEFPASVWHDDVLALLDIVQEQREHLRAISADLADADR